MILAGAQSATGGFAALLVLLLWLWLQVLRHQDTRRSIRFVVLSVALLVGVAASASTNTTALLEVAGKDPGLTGRTDIWQAVLGAVQQRPLTGHGLGAFLNGQDPTAVTRALWRQIGFEAAHAHNGALDVLGQLGLVGLVLHLAALATTARAAAARLQADPAVAALALTVLAAQLLMSVSEVVLLGPWLLVLVLIRAPLLAPVASSHRHPAPPGSDTPARTPLA